MLLQTRLLLFTTLEVIAVNKLICVTIVIKVRLTLYDLAMCGMGFMKRSCLCVCVCLLLCQNTFNYIM